MGKSITRRTLEALATLEDGVWSPMSPLIRKYRLFGGSVYVELLRLENLGFVRWRQRAGVWRNEYQITSAGREALLDNL